MATHIGDVLPLPSRRTRKQANDLVRPWLEWAELELPPNRPLSELAPPDRYLVEFLAAAAAGPRLMVVDGGDWLFDRPRRQWLNVALRLLKRRGVTVLRLSERVGETIDDADRVSAICDGRFVGSTRIGRFGVDDLASACLGNWRRSAAFSSPSHGHWVGSLPEIPTPQGPLELRGGQVVAGLAQPAHRLDHLGQRLAGLRPTDPVEVLDVGQRRKIALQGEALACGFAYIGVGRYRKSQPARLFSEVESEPRLKVVPERRLRKGSLPERVGGLLDAALASPPRLLVIDHCFREVRTDQKASIARRLRKFAEAGSAVLLTTYDPNTALLAADHVLVEQAEGPFLLFSTAKTSLAELYAALDGTADASGIVAA